MLGTYYLTVQIALIMLRLELNRSSGTLFLGMKMNMQFLSSKEKTIASIILRLLIRKKLKTSTQSLQMFCGRLMISPFGFFGVRERDSERIKILPTAREQT